MKTFNQWFNVHEASEKSGAKWLCAIATLPIFVLIAIAIISNISDKPDATRIVGDYCAAIVSRDMEAAYNLLSDDIKAELSFDGFCEEAMKDLPGEGAEVKVIPGEQEKWHDICILGIIEGRSKTFWVSGEGGSYRINGLPTGKWSAL